MRIADSVMINSGYFDTESWSCSDTEDQADSEADSETDRVKANRADLLS